MKSPKQMKLHIPAERKQGAADYVRLSRVCDELTRFRQAAGTRLPQEYVQWKF